MDKVEIFDRLKAIAIEQFPLRTEALEAMTEESLLVEDGLGLDSLDRVELTMRIEDVFGVDFDQEEIDKVEEIGDVAGYVALIEKHLDEK